ncbi:GATA transcription factor (Ams2) [Purpureocillium lilacinum]|nr:GATA transcription factor (Ams2) [Purpureocillium lilacinum]
MSAPAQNQAPVDESGLQVRSMGLKVHYTFDKDSKVNCLARHPHTLQVRTVPVDETSSIGIVDLRACIHAIMDCSPELANSDTDYSIYAVDYSEPNTPLVGQGMLSRALDSLRGNGAPPKMVIGRVTKNLLAMFSGGNKETLEVKLTLSEAKPVRQHGYEAMTPQDMSMNAQQSIPVQHHTMQMEHQDAEHQYMERPSEQAMTPLGTSEWDSFMQSNPQLGHTAQVARIASPVYSQGRAPMPNLSDAPSRRNLPPNVQPGSQGQFPVPNDQGPSRPQTGYQQAMSPAANEIQRVAPIPVEPSEQPSRPASRPSSRASSRTRTKKPPTGRPRGRPRKRPADGNTSGAEEPVTEGEEAQPKKRAKTTKATVVESKAPVNPFATGPESLRVVASTSGSLRNFRPLASSTNEAPGSHLQEVPRAPTPVPEGGPFGGASGRNQNASKLRRESTLSQQHAASVYAESRLQPLSPGQEDGRSPESVAITPFSDGSTPDISSSPPMQRRPPMIRSSPPASSPILPPMPTRAEDEPPVSSLVNDELEDLFGEEPVQTAAKGNESSRSATGKPNAPTRAHGVPIQIFQMQDGPEGQDLVFLRSINGAPLPNHAPAPYREQAVSGYPPVYQGAPHEVGAPQAPPRQFPPVPPPSSDAPTLPPLKDEPAPKRKRAPAKRKPKTKTPAVPAQAIMQPTPPPTTDAARPTSPVRNQIAQSDASPNPRADPEPMQGIVRSNDMGDGAALVAPNQASPEAASPRETSPHQQTKASNEPQKQPTQAPRPTKSRTLARSQSAGALALPQVPASEPAGPSSLSQSTVAHPDPPPPTMLKRAASSGPLALPMPASDPVGPGSSNLRVSELHLPEPEPSNSFLPPVSSPPTRSNKNIVKKNAIKQRLEQAINAGELPPFCTNCGNIETPTWRKIWVQDQEGPLPEGVEFSEKPGMITAFEVVERDENDKVVKYRVIKKSLAPKEDKAPWQEFLLCNPCGIWLCKSKVHRPRDRWDKDFERLGQERRRKGTGRTVPRPKKPRSKSDLQSNLTSEAYLPTDGLGPMEPSSPKLPEPDLPQMDAPQEDSQDAVTRATSVDAVSNPGSTHSRGSGTAKSPIDLAFDEAVGSTKRLLFPSPRKDGEMKVLGEVDVNIVQISDEFQRLKQFVQEEKENSAEEADQGSDEYDSLFRSPVIRPSTPPPVAKPNASTGPFKTPTRPTPSHRPITRSVTRSASKSLRSGRLLMESPSQALALPQQTPSKTPRGGLGVPGSVSVRRSPRNHQGAFGETPISRTINEAFSEFSDPVHFDMSDNMDMSLLPALDMTSEMMDYYAIFSTDGMMPSSPSQSRFEFNDSARDPSQWPMDNSAPDPGDI